MKLHLPTSLRVALIACMACATVSLADTFTAEGVNVTGSNYGNYTGVGHTTMATLSSDTNRFYDGGKGTYWDGYNSTVRTGAEELFEANDDSFSFLGDLQPRIPSNYSSSCTASSFQNLTDDGGLCWAYTSSNVLQYWQSYYGVFAKKARDTSTAAPVHGYTYDKAHLEKLGGTQSLKLNMEFYDHWVNNGGSSEAGLSWYLGGMSSTYLETPNEASGGYFKQYFPNATQNTDYSTCLWADTNLATFSRDLKTLFGQDDGTKGQIVHLDLFSSGYTSHAVTCYGYETDADGNITAVYIANSDDQAHGLIKLTVKWEAMSNGSGAVLYDGDYKWTYAGKDWRITSMNAIDTPDVLKTMLAEYESGKQTWMGNLESWTNTAAVAADVNVLPTDETGWMVYAGTSTEHAGYYNTYYTTGRDVQFNDEATNTTVAVAEDITAGNMTVDNTNKAYSFNGGESKMTITVGDFVKSGSGSLSFSNIRLVADNATLGSDVSFDELHVKGTLSAAGKTIFANNITLEGNATIGAIGSGGEQPELGTTELTISGGTTTITGSVWTNLKSLDISDSARLHVSAASVSVAENISSNASATGSLAEGTTAGLLANWCIKVGTLENGTRKEGTGDVDLKGDMAITQNGYIDILGNAKVTGNISSGGTLSIGGDATVGGNVTSNGTATIGGKLTANTVTLKNGGSIGSIGIAGGTAPSDSTIGTTAMVISGGTVDITSTNWTNLKSLDISGNSKLDVSGASVYVAENITSSVTGDQTTNMNAKWCIKVGTLGEDGKLKANTGDVNLKGNMTAGAYINIMGNADISGTLSTNGTDKDHHITIGGNATVGGSLSAEKNVTIGGLAKLNGGGTVGGTVTAGSMELAAGKSLTATGGLTVNGELTGGTVAEENGAKASITSGSSMTLGGSVENINLQAQSITIAAKDASELSLDSVDITLTGGELSLTNVRVQGDCSFSTTSASPLTMKVDGVIFVLDASNSAVRGLEAQIMTLGIATESSNPIYIDSSMLEGINVEGNMTLDLSHWADEINSGTYDSLVMTFTEDTDFSAADEVKVELGNGTTGTLKADSDAPNTFVLSLPKPEQAIPEPATATLSLLALASLMARRRRK